MDEIEEIKERWKDFGWCKDTKDIQTLLKRVEELEQEKKACFDHLKREMLVNGNPRNCYGCASVKAVLDSLK